MLEVADQRRSQVNSLAGNLLAFHFDGNVIPAQRNVVKAIAAIRRKSLTLNDTSLFVVKDEYEAHRLHPRGLRVVDMDVTVNSVPSRPAAKTRIPDLTAGKTPNARQRDEANEGKEALTHFSG